MKLPFINRRRAEDALLDAERRANQLESVALHYQRETSRLREASAAK